MAAIHGSVSQFDSSKEDWTTYIERLTQYFVANDVERSEKKRAILLSACGPATFKLIRSLLGAEQVATTSCTDIVARMKEHYDPKPSVIVQSLTLGFEQLVRQLLPTWQHFGSWHSTVTMGRPCQT